MTSLYKWIYELTYRFSKPVWDQDTVPAEVLSLAKKGVAGGRALDLGCGTQGRIRSSWLRRAIP